MHYIMSSVKCLELLDRSGTLSIASLRGCVEFMKKKETLNFRVPAEFKRRLIEEAGKERRSLTNYLEITLSRLWDESELSAIKRRESKKN